MRSLIAILLLSALCGQLAHADELSDSQEKVRQLENLQRELLSRVKASQTDQSAPSTEQSANKGLDLATARLIALQEGVIVKRLRDYAPKVRKTVISPSTKEYRLAQYSEDFRQQLERVGNLNFPRDKQGQSLYGSAQVAVEINPDGTILSADITRPARNPKLNEAVLHIVRLAAPFAAFPADIRKDSDVLVLVRTLSFTHEDSSVDPR